MRIRNFRRRLSAAYQEMSALNPPFKPPKAYLNWARANVERWLHTSRIGARPLKLTIDPNNVCQLRCPLCPTGYRVLDRRKGHADLHVFEHLMEELGDYLFFLDFYNWGEPLITPQLPEMIALAHGKGIITNMSSNLSLRLSDERIEALVSSGIGNISCSVDGASQETYSVYRRGGKFDLVLDNMRRIIETRNRLGLTHPLLTWQFVVFRFNEHEQDLATRMAGEIGVDRLQFISPHLSKERFPLSDEDSAAVDSWAPTDPAFNRLDSEHADYRARHGSRRTRCDWHYVSTAINWDGTVAPCCSVFERKDDFGKLDYAGGESYMSIVNNDKFRSVRDRFAGRRSEPSGLVCEQCPSPLEMTYAEQINRRIARTFVLQCARGVRRALPLAGGQPQVVVLTSNH